MAESPIRPADRDQAERLHTFAHDIKNRIGGLWEALRMLQGGPLEGMEKEQLMKFAERGFFHAQRDIEDLMDDFHVERGVSAYRIPFDLVKCVHEAVRNEDYRLRKKDQRVLLDIPEEVIAVGDLRWTTQVLQALLSNASKFSPRGAEITIRAEAAPDNRNVRVTDSGRGLSVDDLKDLFSRYVILTSRSTDGEPQSRGTLARAKQWAEAQGGTLTATSAGPGTGCTFTLTLPSAS